MFHTIFTGTIASGAVAIGALAKNRSADAYNIVKWANQIFGLHVFILTTQTGLSITSEFLMQIMYTNLVKCIRKKGSPPDIMQIYSNIVHSVLAYTQPYNHKPAATKDCTVKPNCTKNCSLCFLNETKLSTNENARCSTAATPPLFLLKPPGIFNTVVRYYFIMN